VPAGRSASPGWLAPASVAQPVRNGLVRSRLVVVPTRPRPVEGPVEVVSCLAALLGGDVAVDVGSDGVRGVAQVLLHDLRVGTGGQEEAGSRVPQGVEVHALQSGPTGQGLEAPQYVARFQRRSHFGGEDEILVDPCPPCPLSILELLVTMCS